MTTADRDRASTDGSAGEIRFRSSDESAATGVVAAAAESEVGRTIDIALGTTGRTPSSPCDGSNPSSRIAARTEAGLGTKFPGCSAVKHEQGLFAGKVTKCAQSSRGYSGGGGGGGGGGGDGHGGIRGRYIVGDRKAACNPSKVRVWDSARGRLGAGLASCSESHLPM